MDERFYRATMKIGGGTLLGRLAFSFLVICSIALGAAIGLLFVYSSDLPEIHALEDYRPVIVTELYADDGQSIGTFALQRRILITYGQIPTVRRDVVSHRAAEGASTLTMQLAGGLFLNRSDRSLHRKAQETMLALQIERHYTKDQIFTMYCNQIYLGAGNYGFEAASEYYFSKPIGQLTLAEAATLAAIIRGPIYSPITHPDRARARRNLVLSLLAHNGKISQAVAESTAKQPLGLHVQSLRNDLAPYFVEEIRKYLEHTYGTAAVHEQGLRAYTTLNVNMQLAANRAVRDGLHAYDRRHGWRGNLPNILRDNLGTLDTYVNDDWKAPIQKGDYVTGLVTSVQPTFAYIKIGPYRALLTPADFSWTAHKSAAELVKPGDLITVQIKELNGTAAEVELEQVP